MAEPKAFYVTIFLLDSECENEIDAMNFVEQVFSCYKFDKNVKAKLHVKNCGKLWFSKYAAEEVAKKLELQQAPDESPQ